MRTVQEYASSNIDDTLSRSEILMPRRQYDFTESTSKIYVCTCIIYLPVTKICIRAYRYFTSSDQKLRNGAPLVHDRPSRLPNISCQSKNNISQVHLLAAYYLKYLRNCVMMIALISNLNKINEIWFEVWLSKTVYNHNIFDIWYSKDIQRPCNFIATKNHFILGSKLTTCILPYSTNIYIVYV